VELPNLFFSQRDVEMFEGDDGDDAAVLSSIQPMQPLMRPTQYMRGIASLHSQNKMGSFRNYITLYSTFVY
jgi:hypothetical protein